MIKFSLQCSNGHGFEAWFPGNDSFADQKARGFVTCPHCNDASVDKTIMAPNVQGGKGRGSKDDPAPPAPNLPAGNASTAPMPAPPQPPVQPPVQTAKPPESWGPEHVAAARQFLHAVRATVQKTHEDVGDKFADEARAIHTGKKPDRGIHGKASKEQIDALLDDGIEVMPLPDPKLDG
ncbi:MAG: DUF1178 family protein [Alphaproteobacteria bacterium]|nr:DUF1178 family protein [Alphaproteobacteria bacterium]